MKVFCCLVLLATMSGAAASSATEDQGSPVEKVVKLLEELKKDLYADQKAEQQIYDKYACWCETASGVKGAMININGAKIVALGQKVLELKGLVAVLYKEISDYSTKIAENEGTQKSSEAVRKKENAAYMAAKAELETQIAALENAITVLAKATGTGLLQGGSKLLAAQKKKAVETVLLSMPTGGNVNPKHFNAIQSFVQELEKGATDASSFTPASATVQGILKDMYDTFTAELESNNADEAKSQRDFEDLTASLTGEKDHATGVVTKKEEEKAAAEKELADTVQTLDDTKAQQDADIEFFDKMKGGCLAKYEEWTARKEARIEEMKGIDEALKILTGDEARALFAKSIKPGMETMLLQFASDSTSATQAATKAYNVLRAEARRAHSLRLASIAATVRSMTGGHFDAVIKEIDKMMQELKDEGAKDVKDRDWCKAEYQTNSEEHADLTWKIERNDAAITKLDTTITATVEEITATVEEIETTEKQIASMESERKDEHKAWQQAKSDDEMAIKLLEKTVDVLSSYHKKHKTFLQEQWKGPEFERSQFEAPEAEFSSKGARKNQSAGIIGILTMLIEDSYAEIKNGTADEIAAQTEFEKNVAAAKKLIGDLTSKKENLETDKASLESTKADEEADLKTNEEDLGINEEYKAKIAPDCDWILNSFEERRQKRKAEMNGLVTAKEFLAASFVQGSARSDKMMKNFWNSDEGSPNQLEMMTFEQLRR